MKKIFKYIFAGLLVIFLIHIGYMFTFAKSIKYKEVVVRSSKIGPGLDGFKIAFITDTHSMPMGHAEEVIRHLNNNIGIDLLLLGGDYATFYRTEPFMRIMAESNAKYGIYGVTGNHDEPSDLKNAMELNGIIHLENSGVRVYENLFIAGTNDLWIGGVDVAGALAKSNADDFVLLLAHNPDTTMVYDVSGADLTLSGHTHGGQITLFGIFAPALQLRKTITGYGARFMSGFAKSAAGTDVYVSRGTGQLKRVPRIFSRPEVTIITIKSEQ